MQLLTRRSVWLTSVGLTVLLVGCGGAGQPTPLSSPVPLSSPAFTLVIDNRMARSIFYGVEVGPCSTVRLPAAQIGQGSDMPAGDFQPHVGVFSFPAGYTGLITIVIEPDGSSNVTIGSVDPASLAPCQSAVLLRT